MDKKADVSTPTAEYKAMETERELPRLLRKGWREIRDTALDPQSDGSRLKLLVKHELEDRKDFKARAELVPFDNIYWDAAETHAGKPFTSPISWSEDTPEIVKDWAADVDGKGLDLRRFARSVCVESCGEGLTHVLVTLDAAGRVVLRHAPAESVIEGSERRARVTYQEETVVADRDHAWDVPTEERIMALYPARSGSSESAAERSSRVEIYRKSDKGDWGASPALVEPLSPQTRIPLRPVSTGSMNPWFALPPLRALAQQERLLINKRSNHDGFIFISNVPARWMKGMTQDEFNSDCGTHGKLSTGSIFKSTNGSFEMGFAELEGGCIQASQADLEAMYRRMESQAMAPLIQRATGSETATGHMLREGRSISVCEAWSLGWADAFTDILQIVAIYLGVPEAQAAKIKVTFLHQFGVSSEDLEWAKFLQKHYEGTLGETLEGTQLYWRRMAELGALGDSIAAKEAAEVSWRGRQLATQRIDLLAGVLPEPEPVDDPAKEAEKGDPRRRAAA